MLTLAQASCHIVMNITIRLSIMSLPGIIFRLLLIISQNLFADFRFEIVKKNAVCI